jgi:hypothetical protein
VQAGKATLADLTGGGDAVEPVVAMHAGLPRELPGRWQTGRRFGGSSLLAISPARLPARRREPDGNLLVILALLGTGTAVLFLAADVLRGSRPHAATLISLAGWVMLGAATLSWARVGRPWGRLWQRAARVAVLAVVAASVLLVYLEHSHVLEAGTNVDAIYTWIGLGWVFALDNPITFVGRTPSYPGSPLMLLSHLPAMAVGFARLGPLAIHLGLLLTVSGLLALMVVLLTPIALLGRQAAAVALAAGCLSTRFVVQGYDAIGYAIAGVCLGFALVAALAVEDVPRWDRAIGGLIALGTLHYSYVGLALALPLCAAWLLLRRHAIREIRAFLSANPILLLIILLMAITMTTHPEMALARARRHLGPDPQALRGPADGARIQGHHGLCVRFLSEPGRRGPGGVEGQLRPVPARSCPDGLPPRRDHRPAGPGGRPALQRAVPGDPGHGREALIGHPARGWVAALTGRRGWPTPACAATVRAVEVNARCQTKPGTPATADRPRRARGHRVDTRGGTDDLALQLDPEKARTYKPPSLSRV